MLLDFLPRKIRSLYDRARGQHKVVVTFFALSDGDGTRTLHVVAETGEEKPLAVILDREDSSATAALKRAGFADCLTGPYFFVSGEWCDQYLRAMSGQEVPIHEQG